MAGATPLFGEAEALFGGGDWYIGSMAPVVGSYTQPPVAKETAAAEEAPALFPFPLPPVPTAEAIPAVAVAAPSAAAAEADNPFFL